METRTLAFIVGSILMPVGFIIMAILNAPLGAVILLVGILSYLLFPLERIRELNEDIKQLENQVAQEQQ